MPLHLLNVPPDALYPSQDSLAGEEGAGGARGGGGGEVGGGRGGRGGGGEAGGGNGLSRPNAQLAILGTEKIEAGLTLASLHCFQLHCTALP